MKKRKQYDFTHEFQQEVLSCALTNGSFLREVRGVLDYEHFTDPIHRIIADFLIDHFDKFGAAPSKGAVLEHLRKTARGTKDLTYASLRRELQSVYSMKRVSAEYIAPHVREFAADSMARGLMVSYEDYAERGLYQEWFKELDDALKLLHPEPALVHYTKGMVERFKSYKGGFKKRRPIPTGIKKLDKLLLGGLGSGELGILMGLTSSGKTQFMVDFGATACERNFKVYHFTLELSLASTLRRYDHRLTGLSDREIAKKPVKLAQALKGRQLMVASYPENSMKPSELRAVIARKGRPDLLIIDSGMNMVPDRRTDRRFELSDIYASLRGLAVEFDCSVWSPIQVNRAGYSTTSSTGNYLTPENVAESFEVTHHADVLLTWNQIPEEEQDNTGRIWVHKNREAPSKVAIDVNVDWSISHVT